MLRIKQLFNLEMPQAAFRAISRPDIETNEAARQEGGAEACAFHSECMNLCMEVCRQQRMAAVPVRATDVDANVHESDHISNQ